jgi:hypothetical protein
VCMRVKVCIEGGWNERRGEGGFHAVFFNVSRGFVPNYPGKGNCFMAWKRVVGLEARRQYTWPYIGADFIYRIIKNSYEYIQPYMKYCIRFGCSVFTFIAFKSVIAGRIRGNYSSVGHQIEG